jgi:predicted Zn-dependent protease
MCLSCSSPFLTRRSVLRLMGAAAAAPAVAACDRVPLLPEETVERLGLETWAQLRRDMRPSANASARARVQAVSRRLIAAAGQDPGRWEVQVFADPGVNAFVLPGRKIGVLEGMVRTAGGDGELAAVIGHEIGHLQAEHPRERLTAELASGWVQRVVGTVLQFGDVPYAQEIAALLGVGVEYGVFRPYSRNQELEADRLGLVTMARAGYDPREAISLWRRMDRLGGSGPAILSTHPAPAARIEAIEAIIPEVTRDAAPSGRI